VIHWLMELAISGRAVIIGLAIALLLSGVYAFSQLDIEAYPDPVQPMVELLTLPNGLSAEEVERLVTVPLEYTLSSTRNLESMRSISLFGLSDIRCHFSWESDYYWDHSETVNQLQFVGLPPGITAGISPENSIGEIYRYTVESPDHDLINEKTVNDWIVSRQLSTVPGVIGDGTFGGLTKQYHVDVDPAETGLLPRPAFHADWRARQRKHQLRRQLPRRRRTGLRRARPGLRPIARRHRQYRPGG
jgi:heavy metal efflux system protein